MPAFAARTTFRAVQRRNFGLLSSLRQMGRSMETHPFQRITTAPTAKADLGKMVKTRLATLGIFVPTAFVVLGWPYGVYKLVDSRL